MTFIVRNILLTFFLIALLIGGLSVYISGAAFYNVMFSRIFVDRVALVEALGRSALTEKSPERISALGSALKRAVRIEDGTRSFWLVDPSTRRILASDDATEEGRVIDRPLPHSETGRTQVSVERLGDGRIVNVTYLNSGGLLWLSLDSSYFAAPAVLFALQQAVLLTVLLAVLGVLFYAVARRYFVAPLTVLISALSKASGGANTQKQSTDLGTLLESFASVAARVDTTLQRDRLVSQMKSDFISTTAHQLRTPLSGINWALGALLSESEKLTPEHKTLVERALEKDKELIALIGTLLNVASIEEGKFGYHREPVSLKQEVEKTVEEERPGAEGQKLKLTLHLPDKVYPEVHVDRERIRWVIRNLIENAVRYSDAGSEIMVSLTQDPKQLQIAVKDSGMGIGERDRPFIFQKFFRTEPAQKKHNDGSGLGLFIAKNIVQAHGGRIWFDSEAGKGSTFYFTLPLSHAGLSGEVPQVNPTTV
jgi:signal transduction histidine kinase